MKKLLCIFSALCLVCLSACGSQTAAPETVSITETRTMEQLEIVDPFGAETEPAVETQSGFTFSVTDLDDQPFTFADCKGAKVIMLNFWEPWCGPCVGEMPELEKLYEDYKDQGLLILGVFSTPNVSEDARSIVADSGVTYPILHGTDPVLEAFTTDYVPTTVFLDADGNVLSAEPFVGARSYADWESIVKEFL